MASGLRSCLNCESLESRETPSNVSVVYNSAHNLIVTGNNSGNIFTLEENLAGDYYVTAGNGTTVNGVYAVNLGVIHPVNIEITDGNGSNYFAIYGVHPSNSLSVHTGTGNDYVTISGVETDYVNVNEGAGENTLRTTSVVALEGADIKAGSGYNVWIDEVLRSNGYLQQSGWSLID